MTALPPSDGSPSRPDGVYGPSLNSATVEDRVAVLQPASLVPSPSKRAFVCTKCNKAFTTAGHLSRHVTSHSGDKPYACPYPGCEKHCSRRDNAVQHFRVHLPKVHRKRNATYVHEAIQYMQNAENPAIAVLHLAGLLPPPPNTAHDESWTLDRPRAGSSDKDSSPSGDAVSSFDGRNDRGRSDTTPPDVQTNVELVNTTHPPKASSRRKAVPHSHTFEKVHSLASCGESKDRDARDLPPSLSGRTTLLSSHGFQESFLRGEG